MRGWDLIICSEGCIGASIRIGREIRCLPYAGIFISAMSIITYTDCCKVFNSIDTIKHKTRIYWTVQSIQLIQSVHPIQSTLSQIRPGFSLQKQPLLDIPIISTQLIDIQNDLKKKKIFMIF